MKIIILLLIANFLFGQSWTVTWDANTEPDLYQYIIYRSTSSNATNQIATTDHPTTLFTDNNIDRGVLYYYRLKARDFSFNESDFSNEVFASMPDIFKTYFVVYRRDTTISFSDVFYDADNNITDIEVSSENNIDVSVNTDNFTISAPVNYNGVSSFLLVVTDLGGFSDTKVITINFGNVTHIVDLNNIRSDLLKIYPNPFNNQVTIEYSAKEVSEITIYNAQGKRIKSFGLWSGNVIWDGKNENNDLVSNGTYIVNLKIKNAVISKKVILIK